MDTVTENLKATHSGSPEELWRALRTQHPEVLDSAVLNRNLTEDMALYIAKSRNAKAETLVHLASDVRFKSIYKVQLAMAKNPKCPQRVALGLLKFLRIFDMADLTRNNFVPVVLRQKAEMVITEKIPALPSGIKIAMSRRACPSLIVKLMERSDESVVDACLDSPMMTEDRLRKILGLKRTRPQVVRAIAAHPKWSLLYNIRYALIRSFHTPMAVVERFIGGLKTVDLQYLYTDRGVPAATRPFIHAELMGRGKGLEPPEDEVYQVSEDADADLEVADPDTGPSDRQG